MFRRFAAALLLISGGSINAAETPLYDLVPPGTKAVIGLHLRALIDSQIVQSLGADLFKTARAKITSSSTIPGIDPFKDLDELVVATTAEGQHPPSLLICRGRFPVEEISKDAERYHGVALRKQKDGTAMALLDAGTMIAGEMKDVQAAIDRRGTHPAGLTAAMAQRVGHLSGKYAIWGTGTIPKDFHPPAGSKGILDGFGSADRFEFGVGVTDGFQLSATVHVRAPEDAQKLAAMMQFVELAAKSRPNSNGTKIETHAENGTVSLLISVPEAEFEKAIEQQRGAIAQAVAQAMAKQGGKGETPQATAPAPQGPPASQEVQIIKDEEGNTLQVILPGKK